MAKQDPAFPGQLEKAIKERWGEAAIKHPLKDWTDEEEAEYQRQKAELVSEKQDKEEDNDLVEKDGFSMPRKLIIKTADRTCRRCGEYSFSVKDDLYMNKFKCCFKCYEAYSLSMAGGDLLNEDH